VLLWLVVEDLLGAGSSPVAGRRITGVLTGIAAGVKVTPLLLLGYLAAVGRLRDAGRAFLAFAATAAIAFLVVPHTAVTFWGRALWEPDRAGGIAYSNNQSLAAVLTRLLHEPLPGRAWLAPALLVAVGSLVVARRLHSSGQEVLALGAVVLGMLLASPISWTHHWVWALVPAVAMWRTSRGGRVLAATFLVLTVTALVYLPQGRGTPDLGWSAWEQVVGNGYALWALAGLGWCVLRGRTTAQVGTDEPASLAPA
jgi:alpha-1,2-mannosyltransferase